MSINITTTLNGSRFKVIELYLIGDAGGDLTDEVISDPSADGDIANTKYSIENVQFSLHGFAANLEFDYLATDSPKVMMPMDISDHLCFEHTGGLIDRSGVDGTGKLLLNTTGLVAGSQGHLVIKLRKRQG